MEYFPAPLEKLVEQFARLPGIGGKSAQRLAFHVLGLPETEAREFAQAIIDAKEHVTCCPVCQNFTAGGLCPICASPRRDGSTICVVADPRDVAAIERSHENRFMTLLAKLAKTDPASTSTEDHAERVVRTKKLGYRCRFCGTIVTDQPDVCAVCEAIGAFDAVEYYE